MATTITVVPMRWIRIDIADELHRALKIRAAEEGITLKELVIQLLREAVRR